MAHRGARGKIPMWPGVAGLVPSRDLGTGHGIRSDDGMAGGPRPPQCWPPTGEARDKVKWINWIQGNRAERARDGGVARSYR